MFNCNWGFMGGHGAGWFMGGFGSLFGLLLLVLLGVLAYRLIRAGVSGTGANRDRKDSLEILKRRYANGDIDAEEYRKIRELLRG